MSGERERKKLSNRLSHSIDGILELKDSMEFPIFETFQRLPLRSGTDYYKYIKNPISLHSVRQKVKKLNYISGQEFIRDLAQITWNARLYNQKGSRVYNHAVMLDDFLRDTIIPRLSQDKAIPDYADLHYPDLGPLPADDEPLPIVGGGSATPDLRDEDYEENQDDDDDYDEYQSLTPQPKRHVPLDPYSTVTRAGGAGGSGYNSPYQTSSKNQMLETGIRRGRPPTVDKPYETRIKLILKSLKKIRNQNDTPLNVPFFDRLPDRNNLPEYYSVVTDPISLFEIKGKLRTRKYSNVDEFLNDLNLMFYNNKLFYGGHSPEVFQDINYFEQEASVVINQELQRLEQELMAFATPGGDGVVRFPLDALEVNGYVYRVGDWVMINNPNEPEKPTVGQIFRLWSLKDGTKYFNACWYYRPEQTCHRYDRLFYINEVCKTGQYRDHIATEIVGPCYVVFLTRYQKGDLEKGVIPEGSPWFICEFRYNESNHVFNRIRTWRACLPDEIRDHPEPPVIHLREPRKLIKYESPIKALLPPGSDTLMEIPNVTEGANPNTPPLVGSVYLREVDVDDDLGQYYTSPNIRASPENDDAVNNRKAYLFTPISQAKSVTYPMSGGTGITSVTAPVTAPISNPYSPVSSHVGTATPAAPSMAAPPNPVAALNTPAAPAANYYTPVQNTRGILPTLPQAPTQSPPKEFYEDPDKSYTASVNKFKQSVLQQQRQYQQNQQKTQADKHQVTPAPGASNVHNVTASYSNVLLGGTVSYAVEDNENLAAISDAIIKRRKLEDKNVTNEIIWYRAPPVLLNQRIATSDIFSLGHSTKYLNWKNGSKQ